MTDLINGRTPKAIKIGLHNMLEACGEICGEDMRCLHDICPYYGDKGCNESIQMDAIAYIQHLEAHQPKWISVKERLPENEKDVLIFGWREGISGKLWPVVMTAFHMDGKVLAQDSSYAWSEGSIEMEYDEDVDDFIVPEGWFEDVQCADEFSMVYDIRVTHWMPKPQPPEEKDA